MWTVGVLTYSATGLPAGLSISSTGLISGSPTATGTSSVTVAQSGSWFAWLDGYSSPHTDTLAQTVTVPTGYSNYTLTYYQDIDTSERSSSGAVDTLTLQVLNSSGTVLSTLSTYSNLNAASGYHRVSVNMSAYNVS